jgi:hypothetical protein
MYHTPPLPYPVALQGATKQHREKGCVAILLPCTPKKIRKSTLRIRTYIPLSEGYLKLLPCVLHSKI